MWLSDFTYVATWQGFVHVAFVLDVLEQALADRQPVRDSFLVHHGNRDVQYISIRYAERLEGWHRTPSSAATTTT